MLDNHQFTLLIVAVGLGALLVSFSAVSHNEINVLTAELEASQRVQSGLNKDEGTSQPNVALSKQSAKIAQRLDSLALSLRHSMISVFFLISFLILLALRIFLWSWQSQPDLLNGPAQRRFLLFDRTLISILVVLLIQLCVSHLVLGIPLFLTLN